MMRVGKIISVAFLMSAPLPIAADETQMDAALIEMGRDLFNDVGLSACRPVGRRAAFLCNMPSCNDGTGRAHDE